MNARYDILLYHGVHEDDLDLGLRNRSGKHIARARFEAEMRHLSRTRPIVTIAQIADAHRGRATLPDGAVAVTFDDGFRNNFDTAWPVLEDCGVPATFYLATGFIGTGRMVWSDRLEAAVLGAKAPRLRLEAEGEAFDLSLGADEEKVAAFLELKALCKSLPDAVKNRLVAKIEDALDAQSAADHALYAFMNWDQAREMNRSPLITFGAHTIDHVALARVSAEEMRRQVDVSVAELSRQLDQQTRCFSYPEGQEADYDDTVIAHLRSHGFDHAPSAIDGSNTLERTHPFHMRRIMVGFEGRPYPFGDPN